MCHQWPHHTTLVDLPPILPKQTLAEFQSDIHCTVEERRGGRKEEGNHCCCSHAQLLASILKGEPHTFNV